MQKIKEGDNLRNLLSGINKAEFVRKNNIVGGASYLHQMMSGMRPISLDAALACARGLQLQLRDISPRLADEVEIASKHIADNKQSIKQEIIQVIELMESTDDRGRLKCLLAVQDAISMHLAVIENSKIK